jgi:hypothetical protein
MLLAVPYQTIELAKLHIEPFHTDKRNRRIAPLLYKDNSLTLTSCSILSPPCELIGYDAAANRLQLKIDNRIFSNRLYAMQDYFANHLFASRVLPALSLKEIHGILQKLYLPTTLTVYAYPSTPVQQPVQPTTVGALEPGTMIQFVLRIHGLLLLEDRGTPHIRIQHSLIAISVGDRR